MGKRRPYEFTGRRGPEFRCFVSDRQQRPAIGTVREHMRTVLMWGGRAEELAGGSRPPPRLLVVALG